MKTKINFIILLMASILVCSCTPQGRLARLVMRHPELVTADTVKINDTVITQETVADTTLLFAGLAKPVVIKKDNFELQLQKMHDTLWIHGRCRPDTIYRRLNIAVEKIKLVKSDGSNRQAASVPWMITAFIALSADRKSTRLNS